MLLVGLVAAPLSASADVALWTELGVDHAVSRRLDVGFDQHLRFDDDVSRVGAVMPELSMRFRVQRWLRLGAGYRYEYERDGDGMLVTRHRFDVRARTRIDVGSLRVTAEVRLARQLRPDKRDTERHVLRERVSVSWRGLRPWQPSASVAVYHVLDDGRLDKLRWTIGGAHARRGRELELFYRLEQPLGGDDPFLHIIGVGFHTGI